MHWADRRKLAPGRRSVGAGAHRASTTYQPWRGWQDGPIGTWTDDTQLTIEVAETVLESGGYVDPERLSERLRAWLPHGRGKGIATTSAVLAMDAGVPWWEAGPSVDSAGNGAAMRAAPVGLAWSMAPDAGPLAREAVLSALPTHAHPVGVAGAVAIAAGVALCIRNGGVAIEPHRFLAFVADAVAGIETGADATAQRSGGGRHPAPSDPRGRVAPRGRAEGGLRALLERRLRPGVRAGRALLLPAILPSVPARSS